MNEETNLQTGTEKAITYDTLLATVLPCPFCGQKPTFDKTYVPSTIDFTCNNGECYVRPSLYVQVKCTPYDETETTFKPEFEQHYKELRDKWNRRF
jgi:hypothetical protein